MSSVFRFEFSDVLNRLGVVVGLVLLVAFTGLPLWILSMTVLATNSLVMPLGAIAVTLLYGDAVAKDLERQLGPSELTRKRSGHLDILSGRPPQASQISCHQNVQQFLSAEGAVVIMSHQKRTMEAAGCLFGVTMQPGVSTANDC